MAKDGSLDWDDLRYFQRAIQAKTLAGAARALGVEHTTVGRRISALESSLGAALLLRGPDGLRLTPLAEKLTPLIEEVERSVLALRDRVASEKSRIRLAVPSGLMGLFTPRLAALRKRRPDLTLEIMSGSRPVDLNRGEADLAVRIGPIADKDLISRRLCDSGSSLYASRAYLKNRPRLSDVNDLSGHDVIAFDSNLAALPAAQWIETRASRATIVLRSREMTDMLAAATSGLGLALLPCLLGDAEPSLLRLTPEVVTARSVSLVYRRESRISEPVREVIRLVVDVLHENASRISGVREPKQTGSTRKKR